MVIKVDASVVLLDIEGTVCPITFVKDVLFPYALTSLPTTLATQWDSPTFTPYRDAFPAEHRTSPQALLSHVQDLTSRDLKIPYLKSLQGYLWRSGYENGSLRAPLFPDVYPSLRKWHEAGIKLIIYSSGSVAAQKLLFKYTNSTPEADITPLLEGYFDTVNAGPKDVRESYEKIVSSVSTTTTSRKNGEEGVVEQEEQEKPGKRWLFLSDNVREVEAARAAGLQSFVLVREGNAPLSEEEKRVQTLVGGLDEIEITRV